MRLVSRASSASHVSAKGGVRLEAVTKTFGRASVKAIDELTLDVEPGELLVLLGPSGCGKTTTLRCIAGLESPDSGRIDIGDRAVFDGPGRSVPPSKRDIGMVFQTYALWPNKTVRSNIAYPLRARRLKQGLADGWVDEAADLVECSHLLDRYPGQLSGGQQQRIALARGLVARPTVVLFDEPLSNLDAKLRDQVRGELHSLHQRLGFTSVYVTHDQFEALAIGDRLAVLRDGRLEQADVPSRVFNEPATDYVADFLGYANRIVLARTADGWSTPCGGVSGLTPQTNADQVALRIRPEDLEVHHSTAAPVDRLLIGGAKVIDTSYAGRNYEVMLAAGSSRVRARLSAAHLPPAEDSVVGLSVAPEHIRVFSLDGEALTLEWACEPNAAAAV